MFLKYKDADPKDTLHRIKSTFAELNLNMVCQTEQHMNGVYTSTLTDPVCCWKTEGKGTDIPYCEASAYGEAMEHLCTHYAFDISTACLQAQEYGDFFRYPDEQKNAVMKISEISPNILDDLREPFVHTGGSIPENQDILSLWEKILKTKTTTFVPYYDVNQDKEILLPDAVLSKLCGTNGGGCGNTPEEAIGHALDEIIERWSKYIIFSNRLTPPEVPDSFLQKRAPKLFQLKQEIEHQGNLRVLVLDGSLGKNYPVAILAIIDWDARRYLVNFGCHPQFEIALERCFTEIFQDRKIVPEVLERKDMSVWGDFDRDKIFSQCNWAKLLEDDLGLWPEEFFAITPSWTFQEWPVYKNYSNKIGLQIQIEHLRRDGAEIFIRNLSFLGFPVFKVYIPQISTSHILFKDDILFDLDVVKNIRPFLAGILSKTDMRSFGDRLFGHESILGRMFFYSLTNEEFDLLHAAFLMEYGTLNEAYNMICHWNGPCAYAVCRIMEMSSTMSVARAEDCAKRFCSQEAMDYAIDFFSEHPFPKILARYGFNSNSRKSMSRDHFCQERGDLLMRIKNYMMLHPVDQMSIKKSII